MPIPILLSTLNAKYPHSAFGLRYLHANLQELRSQARIEEFTIQQKPRDIVERILALNPTIVGFGVYIWNTTETEQVVSILKRVRPELIVVLGGPEVSYETEGQAIVDRADFVIPGEADHAFYRFCRDYLGGGRLPSKKVLTPEIPPILEIESPYALYTDADIKNRVLYVEASRGCPYKCEYCLSSLDKSVRGFDLELFLADMQKLLDRGARQFKFVDRTFNLSVKTSSRILEFFLERISLGLFLHFEMVPDRLPPELKTLISKFPLGALQFEIGIQTWSPQVAALVSRRQDYSKVRENFAYLNEETGVHLHADLIVGLPGETLTSFAEGFDAVTGLGPHEVQVGILKRLKGTPIVRHDQEWGMVYQEHPPFQILKTRTMDFETLQKMARFSKFWDLYANSGNFLKTMDLLIGERGQSSAPATVQGQVPSRFQAFWDFSEFLSARHAQSHSIALLNLVESFWVYLTDHRQLPREQVRRSLAQDYAGTVKRDLPAYLRSQDPVEGVARLKGSSSPSSEESALPARQRRHHELPPSPMKDRN